MPYLKIVTNRHITADASPALLSRLSKELARELNKPERYVMVELVSGASLNFGGSDTPAAYVELKSIGLDTSQTKHLSASLSGLLRAECGIAPDRVYIEFVDIQGHLWGWNGGTF